MRLKINPVYILGKVRVKERDKFKKAIENGIGRGKIFGFGLPVF
jgi:hypothetical protein